MSFIAFLGTGILLGISFLKAALQFLTPNTTLVFELGIRGLAFGVLTKIEPGLITKSEFPFSLSKSGKPIYTTSRLVKTASPSLFRRRI